MNIEIRAIFDTKNKAFDGKEKLMLGYALDKKEAIRNKLTSVNEWHGKWCFVIEATDTEFDYFKKLITTIGGEVTVRAV